MQALSQQLRSEWLFGGQHLAGWREIMSALRPKIEKALDHGGNTYSFDNLVLAVERSRLKLFYRPDAVLFCEMTLYPQYKTLDYVLMAGTIAGLSPLEECARAWGRAMGCVKVRGGGRPGWAKIARQRGWKRSPHVHFSMELNDA